MITAYTVTYASILEKYDLLICGMPFRHFELVSVPTYSILSAAAAESLAKKAAFPATKSSSWPKWQEARLNERQED